MPLDVLRDAAIVVGAAIAIIIVGRILRRRALRKLVRERIYSGLCIICGADLRFGKELCPKCGHKVGWLEAQIWDQIVERRKAQQSPDAKR